MTRSKFCSTASIAALAVFAFGAQQAFAQAATVPTATEANSPTKTSEPDDIVVTGSARQQRRFDVAYAVNSLSQADIQKIAPKSMADLLGK